MDKTAEVFILKTIHGKRIYMLQIHNSDIGATCEDNKPFLTGTNLKPLMWSRKADMIAWAKKNGFRLIEGYWFSGGKTWGRGPFWD